jgi:hypothetical protein
MNTQTKRRIVTVVMTVGWAVAEWLLIELRRLPYRPPHDMRTLLGTERDAIPGLMVALAVGWLFCLVVFCVCPVSQLSRRDCVCFALLIIVLIAIIGGLVMFPWWPVTPYELLWSAIESPVLRGGQCQCAT